MTTSCLQVTPNMSVTATRYNEETGWHDVTVDDLEIEELEQRELKDGETPRKLIFEYQVRPEMNQRGQKLRAMLGRPRGNRRQRLQPQALRAVRQERVLYRRGLQLLLLHVRYQQGSR